MASAAEQLAANLNFGAFAKAEELKKRIWFTLGALLVYRLGTYIPLPGIDPEALAQAFNSKSARHPRHVQHVRRRRGRAHGDLRARHHAVYLGVDHHSADDVDRADARAAQEGRRAAAARINQYTRYGTVGLRACRPTASPSGSRAAPISSSIRAVLPGDDRHHAGRRHDVPDVARRADHRARRRQRHLADHLRRHRRQPAECDRRTLELGREGALRPL